MSIVRALSAEEAHARADELADILLDCIAGGASVSFMATMTRDAATAFFRSVAEAVATGDRVLFAAEREDLLVGTVQLITAMPPNQPHRAEIAKLLAHRSARGTGLGAALMQAAENEARRIGKTLLCLDTAVPGGAAGLYEALGFVQIGIIPGYALYPDGRPCDTVVCYKILA